MLRLDNVTLGQAATAKTHDCTKRECGSENFSKHKLPPNLSAADFHGSVNFAVSVAFCGVGALIIKLFAFA